MLDADFLPSFRYSAHTRATQSICSMLFKVRTQVRLPAPHPH